ncbi:MAG: DUF2341 domain-containing protein [Desulfatibacillaceae bacterium]
MASREQRAQTAGRRTTRASALSLMLAVAVFCLATPALAQSEAEPWWNADWQYRMRIGMDTTAAGANVVQNVPDVPVLVRLHPGNFMFENCKLDGTDIRFVDGSGKEVLKHHIEKFDSTDEMGMFWVRIPRLSGGSNYDFIWMYYGNPEAIGGQNMRGTYDTSTQAVFHFTETQGPPQDATGYGNHATEATLGQGFPAVIGNGVNLAGGQDGFVVPDKPSVTWKDSFTFSTWLRIAQPVPDAVVMKRATEDGAVELRLDGSQLYARVTSDWGVAETERAAEISPEGWHHVALTATSNGRLEILVDGMSVTWTTLAGSLPQLAAPVHVGSFPEESGFFGDLDEVRFAMVARPDSFISASYMNERPDGRLLALGNEEVNDTGGLPTFYLATVMRNITLDGWVIIGLLLLFAVISWLVFMVKSFNFFLMSRDDKAFVKDFASSHSLLTLDHENPGYPNSALYAIYRDGRKALESAREDKMPAADLVEEVAAALERGYVTLTHRLNAGVVILTMAITGGPFLGLLGTVWGVMNTFAAMAEAGDANIMAIAPGVASALSTTVFGLIVAIPALFGYNYIVGKVRTKTAEAGLFVDEYRLKVERAAKGGRI